MVLARYRPQPWTNRDKNQTLTNMKGLTYSITPLRALGVLPMARIWLD